MSERPASKQVSEWQYETIRQVMGGELEVTFSRKTAVLKGTEAHGGHNTGLIHTGEQRDYISEVESAV